MRSSEIHDFPHLHFTSVDPVMALPSGEHTFFQLLHTFGFTSGRHLPPDALPSESSGSGASPPDDSGQALSFPFTSLADFGVWLSDVLTTTGCSDIYLSPDGVRLLVHQTVQSPPTPVPWNQAAARQVLEWMTVGTDQLPGSQDRFCRLLNENGGVDTSCVIAGHRFRVSIFYTRRQMAFVLRHIPPGIRHFSHLTLPPVVFTHLLEHLHRGWLLIAGPSGSGKSSTLSACIEFWNTHRSHHILVIEDPVEYFYESRKSLIHQREVGTDTPSFAQALRSALRQSSQIIVIGEIRDEETARLALQAAETGHLVAATIHAPDTFGALRRLVGFFPEAEQSRLWMRLVESFSAVISQVLLPSLPIAGQTPAGAGGGFPAPQRIPAIEVLRSSFHIRQLLLSSNCSRELVTEAIEHARHEYMIAMDDYLSLLIESGRISLETALTVAQSPSNLKLRMTSQMQKY